MTWVSTHVLDTVAGRPGAGVGVTLTFEGSEIARGVTGEDGRLRVADDVHPGRHRLTFETAALSRFYPSVSVEFVVEADEDHYHLPLLLSAFGYTTYRGS